MTSLWCPHNRMEIHDMPGTWSSFARRHAVKKRCCCTYSSIENSTRDSWQTIVAGYILSQIPSKRMHLCTVMEKNNTSGRKSAGNFKQRNDFSCFAACTVCGAYTHTHTYQQTSPKHAIPRTNKQHNISLILGSRCGFKKIQIQLVLRWIITPLNKVDDFVYLLPSLLITSESEPNLFTTPFTNHFSTLLFLTTITVHGKIDSSQARTVPHFFHSYRDCGINVYI